MVKKILLDVHAYWFGTLASPTHIPADKAEMWFGAAQETDDYIRENFGKYLPAVKDTAWDVSNLSRMEQVGLIVLLDQFPRNIHRDSGEAFAYDAKARGLAREMLKNGGEDFYLAERQFVVLPFMHSEDVADQDYCVWFCANEVQHGPAEHMDRLRMTLDFATKHRDIVRKFGRFPHRNEMMGRESTPEELEFLKGGRGF